MDQDRYYRELEDVFAHLVNQCATSFSTSDLDRVIPLLEVAATSHQNFEASLLLALYFDPAGCLFPNVACDHAGKKSKAEAFKYYKLTYDLSKEILGQRAFEVFKFVEETLSA